MSGKSCAAKSQIGSGSATASADPLPQPIAAGVKAFAGGPHKMILVLKATQPVAETLIVRATATGSKLTIPMPTPSVAGLKMVLVSLQSTCRCKAAVAPSPITAGRCTDHNFIVRSHFMYDDGSTMDLQSTSPCS